MHLYWLFIIFGATQIIGEDLSQKDYYDPNYFEDQVFLIKTLFVKLNKVVQETERIAKNFQELKKSYGMKSLNQNGEWTVFQRRQDGSVDFYRNWTDYKYGFGDPHGEFFLGLERLHAMTTYGSPQELLIVVGNNKNERRYAKYDKFVIGRESEKYALKELGIYSGDAGDDLTQHKGQKFSTKGQDNDDDDEYHCAERWAGAWWFKSCFYSHLNGPYVNQTNGIYWNTLNFGGPSLKFVEMMIRSTH